MPYQLWIRALLKDATSHNKSHLVARLSPHMMRELYEQGVSPSIQEIVKYCQGKAPSKAEDIDGRSNQGTLATAV